MVLYGVKIQRWRIKEYFTDEILETINLYWKCKIYGWPFDGGWAQQPKFITDLVFLLDQEYAKRKKIDGQR